AALAGSVEDSLHVEVRSLGRRGADRVRLVSQTHVRRRSIRLAEHRHRLDAQLPARSDDANGNLAPVGNQEPADVCLLHTSVNFVTGTIWAPAPYEHLKAVRAGAATSGKTLRFRKIALANEKLGRR